MSLIEHLEKLRHFYKVSSYHSINEAAKATGLSQAGLSKSIASLEGILGASLFVRSRNGLILTKEGELLKASARTILDEAANVEASLRSLKAESIPEKVRFGMYDSIAVYFFPDLSKFMRAIYPTVELEIVVDSSRHLLQKIERREVDLALGVNLRSSESRSSEFFTLFEDHYAFYASPEREPFNNRSPLIIHPDATDAAGKSCTDHLAKIMRNRLVHKVYNFETLKTLTASGFGTGVLPTQVAKPLLKTGALITVYPPRYPRLFGKHEIGFLTASKFIAGHRDFAEDIFRLGNRWSKL